MWSEGGGGRWASLDPPMFPILDPQSFSPFLHFDVGESKHIDVVHWVYRTPFTGLRQWQKAWPIVEKRI